MQNVKTDTMDLRVSNCFRQLLSQQEAGKGKLPGKWRQGQDAPLTQTLPCAASPLCTFGNLTGGGRTTDADAAVASDAGRVESKLEFAE
jgi:hypothetical protein